MLSFDTFLLSGSIASCLFLEQGIADGSDSKAISSRARVCVCLSVCVCACLFYYTSEV